MPYLSNSLTVHQSTALVRLPLKLMTGKVVPAHVMKACRGRRAIAPFVLNLGSIWRPMINFTLRPLYTRERNPVPIEYDAGWVQEPVWTFWRGEKSLFSTGIRTFQPVSKSLNRLGYPCCNGLDLQPT
jgi:hypothetical protein